MIILALIPLAAVCSVPITIGVIELVHYIVDRNLHIKHWPPNYWW